MTRLIAQDLAMFAQINANHPRLIEYLRAEREETVKFMAGARDPVVMHRYQGDLTRLDRLITLLVDSNKNLANARLHPPS